MLGARYIVIETIAYKYYSVHDPKISVIRIMSLNIAVLSGIAH